MRRPRPRGYQNNHILLFDQAAILSSRPALSRAGARSGRQGWPQATAQRLLLDGREHDGTIEADRTTLSPLTPWPAEPMSPSIGPSSQPLTLDSREGRTACIRRHGGLLRRTPPRAPVAAWRSAPPRAVGD